MTQAPGVPLGRFKTGALVQVVTHEMSRWDIDRNLFNATGILFIVPEGRLVGNIETAE